MKVFAQLDENGICRAITKTSGDIIGDNIIDISNEVEPDDILFRRWEDDTWSAEKFQPHVGAPLTEYEQLKEKVDLMQAALDEIILGGGL